RRYSAFRAAPPPGALSKVSVRYLSPRSGADADGGAVQGALKTPAEVAASVRDRGAVVIDVGIATDVGVDDGRNGVHDVRRHHPAEDPARAGALVGDVVDRVNEAAVV